MYGRKITKCLEISKEKAGKVFLRMNFSRLLFRKAAVMKVL